MNRTLLLVPMLAPMLLSGGCASPSLAQARAPVVEAGVSVEFIASTMIEHAGAEEGAPAPTGLSGLVWDHHQKAWLAIGDGARAAVLWTIDADAAPDEEGVWRLSATARDPIAYLVAAQDAEAITLDPQSVQRQLYISYEKPPSILRWENDAAARSPRYAVPEAIVTHFRPNFGFESLALRRPPSEGPELWAAMESALTIDGEEAATEIGARCRVAVFDPNTGELMRELFYDTDPRPRGVLGSKSFNSLVELCALPDGRLLALERSLSLQRGFDATLFILDGSTSAPESAALPVLNKQRLASVRTLGLPVLGNIEGMALGPELGESGARMLLMIADDNGGRDGQRGSQVVALRLRFSQ